MEKPQKAQGGTGAKAHLGHENEKRWQVFLENTIDRFA